MKIRSDRLKPASPEEYQSVRQRKATPTFADRRPEAVQQRQLIQMMQQSSRVVAQRQQMQGQIPQGEVVQGYFVSDHRISGEFTSQVARDKRGGGKTFIDAHDASKANLATRKKSFLRIATNGNLAIEDSAKAERQAKVYYSTIGLYKIANKKLRSMNSPLRLIRNNKSIHVTDENGKKKQLYQIVPTLINRNETGTNVKLPENCNEVACTVTNTFNQGRFNIKYKDNSTIQAPTGTVSNEIIKRLATFLPAYRDISQYNQKGYLDRLASGFGYGDAQSPTKITRARAGTHAANDEITGFQMGLAGNALRNRMNVHSNRIGEGYAARFLNQAGSTDIENELGINEHIKPTAGDVLMINTIGGDRPDPHHPGSILVHDHRTGTDTRNPAPYHFATVIIASGSDYITIENYARQNEEADNHGSAVLDPRYFFRMYGPGSQSFHEENQARYPNALTVRLEK